MQVLYGDLFRTHVTGHLFAFEYTAWILALAGGTVGAVRDGDAVASAHTSEIMPFHGTGKALTDRNSAGIHILTGSEVIDEKRCT